MKKIIFLLLIILVLPILTGCELNVNQDSEEDELEEARMKDSSYVGGTSGIELSFDPEYPPEKIYKNDGKVPVKLVIENKGEYKLQPNELKAMTWNLPSQIYSNFNDLYSNSLYASFKDNLGNKHDGENSKINVGNIEIPNDYTLPIGGLSKTIKASICYKYETYATASLCFVGDPKSSQSICDPNKDKVSYSQSGAPVQISNLKQSLRSDTIDFTFTIENKGKNDLFEHDASLNCDSNEITTRDRVKINLELNNAKNEIHCSGLESGQGSIEGYVKLYNNQNTINCRISGVTTDINYQKDIKITLTYDYKNYVEKSITLYE